MRPEQPPKRIFLQRDDDDNADWDGTSWCEDPINDGDVEYIRADLARPTPSPSVGPDLEAAEGIIWDLQAELHRLEEGDEEAAADAVRKAAEKVLALPSPAAPLEALRKALGPDAAGRPFSSLLRIAGTTFQRDGGGPLADCLMLKAAEVEEAEIATLSPSSTAPSDPYPIHTEDGYCRKAPSEGKEKGPGEKGKEDGGLAATLPEASPRDPKLKVQRFKLSPELADGQHWTVCDTPDQLLEVVRNWCENEPMKGDDFSVEVIEMSDEELNALPEI